MSKKTVFVIGAGASAEANLPTSDGLKNKIATSFDQGYAGYYIIYDALRNHVHKNILTQENINLYLNEVWHIKEAMPLAISIDNYLDAHRDNDKIALCGKLAIVRSILEAEKGSFLSFKTGANSNINFKLLQKTKNKEEAWFLSFFKLLTENCASNELKERFESITLIIFNYDRCIEHFLYYALQTYYPELSPDKNTEARDKIAELVKSINIYHPYGDVGSLPWINQDETTMGFGEEPNGEQLLRLSNRIKTFTEGTDSESSEIVEIRKHMGSANRVVFLGFAFHPQNMELIAPGHVDETVKGNIHHFATTFGFSHNDEKVIEEQIKGLYHKTSSGRIIINMENLECAKFFKAYGKSLSFTKT